MIEVAVIPKMAINGEWEDEPGGKLIPAMKIGKNISQVKCKGLNYQGERNKSGPTLCYTRSVGGGSGGEYYDIMVWMLALPLLACKHLHKKSQVFGQEECTYNQKLQ